MATKKAAKKEVNPDQLIHGIEPYKEKARDGVTAAASKLVFAGSKHVRPQNYVLTVRL